jgi:hypothetical protein
MLVKVNVVTQLSEACRSSTNKHNEEVTKNRHKLSKIFDCIKFCGKFALVLLATTKSWDSFYPEVF